MRAFTLVIYTFNENYTIWQDEEYNYYIEMADAKEMEDKAYATAAMAIEEAESRC